jgi:signal transduction histidine kinase
MERVPSTCPGLRSHAVAANSGEKRIAIRLHPNKSHRKIHLEVEDNGTGVSNRLYDRIFEPFFSTKHDEARSGLRLTIANRIIIGRGSLFTIELPTNYIIFTNLRH